MTCGGYTKSGKPCRAKTNKPFCHHHQPNLKLIASKKKIEEQRNNLNILNSKLTDARTKITDLIIETNEIKRDNDYLKEQLDIQEKAFNQKYEKMENELKSYQFIREFEKIYSRVKGICKTDDLIIIKQKLYQKDTKLVDLLGDNPAKTFDAMRRERNKLVHAF